MNKGIFTLSILSVFLLCSFTTAPGNTVLVSGHLKHKSAKNKNSLDGIYMCAKEDDKIVAETETDEDGNFTLELEREEDSKKPVTFFYVNDKSDTVMLKRIPRFSEDTPDITFTVE